MSRSLCCLILLANVLLAQDAEHPRAVHQPAYPRVIKGIITNSVGNPVPDARLEWGPRWTNSWPNPGKVKLESVRSDASGKFELRTQQAGPEYTLRVSAAGFLPQWKHEIVPGPPSDPTILSFQLADDEPLEIQIVDANGVGLPGLGVLPLTPSLGIYSSFSSPSTPEILPGHPEPAVTNAEGRCRLTQLLPAPGPLGPLDDEENRKKYNNDGWLMLHILRGDAVFHQHQISRLEYHASKGAVTVVMPASSGPIVPASLWLRVVDSDGNPLPEAQFTLRHSPDQHTVNEEGHGSLEVGNQDYRYEVRAFCPGFAPQVAKIAPKETSELHPSPIVLQPHTPLRVKLVDAMTKEPIANAPLISAVIGERATTDYIWEELDECEDGRNGMEDVFRSRTNSTGRALIPEGDRPLTLVVYADGYAFRMVRPAERPEPAESGELIIPLAREARLICRRAETAMGREISYCYLTSAGNIGGRMAWNELKFDESEMFTIKGLPAGDWWLSGMHVQGNVGSGSFVQKLKLQSGETREVELGKLPGKLTLAGRTQPFHRVEVSQPGEQEFNHFALTADVDGYFQFNQLLPGQYQVIARQHGLQRGLLAAERQISIDLQQDAFIDLLSSDQSK